MSVLNRGVFKFAVISLAVMIVILCVPIGLVSAEEIFLRKTPPAVPEGNINLIDTHTSISDTSNKEIDWSYNKLTHTLKNTVDDKNAYIRFEDIKGLKMSDTYMIRTKLTVFTAQPSIENNDKNSMGARIIFRGNDTRSMCFFSLFATNAGYYSYVDGSLLHNNNFSFSRELGREYDICILSAPNEVSVWVDNELVLNFDEVPNYEPFIGIQIYRASVQLSDIEVYNMSSDNADDFVEKEVNNNILTSYKEFDGVEGVLPPTDYDMLVHGIVYALISGVISLTLIAMIIVPIIKHVKKKKGEET